MAPATYGPAFAANYDGQPLKALYDRNKTTMPQGAEGSLTPEQYADATAFILMKNDFPAGDKELPPNDMGLAMIKYIATKP